MHAYLLSGGRYLSVWIRRKLEISPKKAMSDEFMEALQRFFNDLRQHAIYGELQDRICN
jgi:hypothetical protein